MALDEDGFLPAASRKVQKIGKGLKSNGTSNTADKETDSRGFSIIVQFCPCEFEPLKCLLNLITLFL